MFGASLHTPRAHTTGAAVTLREVHKVSGRGDGAVAALDGVTVALAPGSFTAPLAPPRSGKSTFLNIAAGLDRPTPGSAGLSDPRNAEVRGLAGAGRS